MKTFTFFSVPATGHVNPMLVVAEELARRGNRVIFYSFKVYQSRIEEAGLEFRDYGMFEDLDGRIARIPIAAIEKSLEVAETGVPSLIQGLREDKSDCVVHDGIAVWGKVSAHAAGIKAVSFVPNFVFTKSVLLSYAHRNIHMVTQMFGHGARVFAVHKRYYALMKKYGMPRVGFLDAVFNKEPLNIVCTSRKFHPSAKEFDKSFVFIGASLGEVDSDPEFMDMIKPDKKIIYISLGTVFNDNPNFYRTCIETFRDKPFQVVISLGQHLSIGDFKDVPENITLQNYIPQRALLEKTDVFITHGGMNSISESIYAGVPMVLIPQIDEQRMNSIRAEKLGAGIYLRKHQVSSKCILKAIERILSSDSYRIHTLELQRALLESGGRERAADKIEEYASIAA